jgi:hypothetical protein
MHRRSWKLIPGLLLMLSACARGGGGGDGGDEPEPAAAPVRVEVFNNYALPVEVFALGSGTSHRLGTVHPGMAGHFVVPPTLLGGGGVELEARPGRNEQPFSSDPLLLAPGTVVDFTITPQLFNSTVTLRP